jgi:hypothetical protein
MWNVNSINISYNAIEILEENAFNGFDGNIDFKYNKIKIIGEFAFNNAAKYVDYISNPTPIVIDFSNTRLKSSAFRENSFNVTNAKLIFNSNELQYLPQETFEPFLTLHSGNRLEVKINDFYCDCRMKWILDKSDPKYNIKGILCTTQKVYIYRLTINDLNRCIWKRAIAMILFQMLQMISNTFLKNYVIKPRL